MSLQQIRARPLQSEEDFWRVHRLLSETYPVTPLGLNWDVRRWEGMRFYDENTRWPSPRLAGRAQLWETTAGQLVGAVFPEGMGDAHLQVHPNFRYIEPAMTAWAEEHLTAPTQEGRRQLAILVYEYDIPRRHLLAERGYAKSDAGGVVRRLRLASHPLLEPTAPTGYTLRTTNPADLDDCQRIADLLNAAFNRTFHTAAEYRNFTQLAPSFRQELDLVMQAPDGTLAAYVGIPYDKANHRGIFEPVCTHPAHRQHGLAKALMLAGLRRLFALGGREATVETGLMIPANRLYDSIGFTEVYQGDIWRRAFVA
ncbi:MAG: GNAT family N-acetyltransferase [Caldilineaceae bacterium]